MNRIDNRLYTLLYERAHAFGLGTWDSVDNFLDRLEDTGEMRLYRVIVAFLGRHGDINASLLLPSFFRCVRIEADVAEAENLLTV